MITFLIYLAVKIKNLTVSLSFLSFAVILMVFGIGFSLNILENTFGTYGSIIDNYSVIYILFTVLLVVGAIGLILYLIVVALNYYWSFRGTLPDIR